ncbi:hypothetical protein [Natrinema salinisoli]|uniref:hypothetical protein n=1 Tax=Natrinema salinisoli TaxID=2878535 RepID=UPI001CEFCD24|nr:hypothetical protein [Natrinema salinisoli]
MPNHSEDQPPDCPHCGRPVTAISVVGPTEAYVSPCGCEIAPGLLATGFER